MSKPSDAELIAEGSCLPDGEFVFVDFAKELAQRLKALTEENARLKGKGCECCIRRSCLCSMKGKE